MLFFQWHHGDAPQKYRAFAARNQRYTLMQPQGSGTNPLPDNLAFRLYDIANDPFEQTDLSKALPEIVSGLKADYERWFDMVTGTRDYADRGIARINVGSPRQNPVRLTRQDWRGPEAAWSPKGLGHWESQ